MWALNEVGVRKDSTVYDNVIEDCIVIHLHGGGAGIEVAYMFLSFPNYGYFT